MWITDIHPESAVGKVASDQEGTYWIDLPDTYDTYIESLQYSYRKKYRAILRKNEDLHIIHDQRDDVDALWPYYIEKIQSLANQGGQQYSEDELTLRRRFFDESKMKRMSFYLGNELLACNVSYWDNKTVYDIACLIKPSDEHKSRSLGSYAILKNIEYAIAHTMTHYDLLSVNYGYKTSFGATEHKLKTLIICTESFAKQYGIPEALFSLSTEK